MKWVRAVVLWVAVWGVGCRAADVAVWGWRTARWLPFLEHEFGVSATVLTPTPDGRVPVAEFASHKAVILDQGGPASPATAEDLAAARLFVSGGGRILLFSGTVSAWLHGENAYDLARASDLLGAARYVYSGFEATCRAPGTPLLPGCGEFSPAWFRVPPALGRLTTGRALVAGVVGGDLAARILVNAYGDGCVFYCAPVAIDVYRDGWADNPEARSQVRLVQAMVGCALRDEPGLATVLATAPKRKLECFRVGDRLRSVTVRAAPDCTAAATALVRLLNRATNAELRVNDAAMPGALTVMVGLSEAARTAGFDLSELHPYGYHIRLLGPDLLVLAGRNPTATMYAVYDLLKRFAGYRSFMPGDLGEIMPEQEAVSLPLDLALVCEPAFTSYTNTGFYGGNGAFSRSWRTTCLASHWLKVIYPAETYGEAHPEYYTLVEGQRYVPPKNMGGTWQPCVSNPDLPALAVRYARDAWFPNHPEALGLSVGVNDGGGDCHCPACSAWRAAHANAYIPFYNAVARRLRRECPGRFACFIAYGGAAKVPEGIRIEPNLYVEVCSGLQRDLALLRGWQAAGAQHLALYDYLYGAGYVLPRHYPHILGNAWKRAYREYNLRGAWTESFVNVWLYDGPRQYVLNELAWNIEADIEALLADYFERFYGVAAAPMRAFFERIEAVYGRKPDPLHPIADWKSVAQFAEYTEADLAHLDACVAAARAAVAAVAEPPEAARRVELFAKIYGLTRLYLEAYLSARALEQLPADAGPEHANAAMAAAGRGVRAARAIAAYTMTAEEQKLIFTHTDLDSYRNVPTLRLGPLVETAADAVFSRLTAAVAAAGGVPQVREYWGELAGRPGTRAIRELLRTQIYTATVPAARENLIRSGGFEPADEATAPAGVLSTTDLERFDWRRLDRKLPGWSTWHFQQSVTRFYWDPTEARSGDYSLSVRENQISGCFQTAVKVKSGCRYRLTFWIRQDPPELGGALAVRWMNAKGWADQGAAAVPRITVPYPQEDSVAWREVTVTFTAPPGVSTCLPLFSAPRQTADQATWFDDVTLVKIYDPAAFAGAAVNGGEGGGQ